MSHPPDQRYKIERRLDAGGMAEVFVARSVSLAGFEKNVAIKRVLPNLVENERFVRMFLDEARLSLELNHANIVSVFEVGRTNQTYFIVMEYVEGTNLKALLKKTPLPAPLAVYVVLSVCKALTYAHRLKDAEGRPLEIVHRDVSPPNILLSWQGEVKLTDFGLARAKSQIESTDPGVLKGKFAYLSPEAVRGEEIDHRADIFASGVVLWEAITGERLFQGSTDLETVENLKRCEVPRLAATHGIPEELDDILARALASDPDERFATAREFGRALAQLLVTEGESVTEYDLSEWLFEHIYADQPSPRAGVEGQTSGEQQVEAELRQFVTLDEDLHIAAVYDAPEPGAAAAASRLEDPRSWSVFEAGDEDRGFFAQLANSGPYRAPVYDDAGNLLEPASAVPPPGATERATSASNARTATERPLGSSGSDLSRAVVSGRAKPPKSLAPQAQGHGRSNRLVAGLGIALFAVLIGLAYLISR